MLSGIMKCTYESEQRAERERARGAITSKHDLIASDNSEEKMRSAIRSISHVSG